MGIKTNIQNEVRDFAGLVSYQLQGFLQYLLLAWPDFSLVEQVFSPARQLFGTNNVSVLLLHASLRLLLLVIIVVHRCHSWVVLLIDSLLWMAAWHFLVPRKLSPQEEGFQISSSSRTLGPGSRSKLPDIFSNRDLSSTSEGQPGATAIYSHMPLLLSPKCWERRAPLLLSYSSYFSLTAIAFFFI